VSPSLVCPLLLWLFCGLALPRGSALAFVLWLAAAALPALAALARLAVSRWLGCVVFWPGVGAVGGAWRRSALAVWLWRGGLVRAGLVSRAAWWRGWRVCLFGRSLRRW